VVNTLCEDELEAILDHANAQRNSVQEADMVQESITMSNEMADLM
jgi:hypothetical protein